MAHENVLELRLALAGGSIFIPASAITAIRPTASGSFVCTTDDTYQVAGTPEQLCAAVGWTIQQVVAGA